MIKKIFLIATLGICLMVLMATSASAFPPTLGGWYVKPGSASMTTEWVGIANTDLKPTDVIATLRINRFYIDKVLNPGGEDGGGPGQPFIENPTDPIFVSQSATIRNVPIKGRGKYDLPVEFTDKLLTKAIIEGASPKDLEKLPKLPNENWYWHVVILDMDVLIEGYTDINDRCPFDPNDNEDFTCTEIAILNEEGDVVDYSDAEEVVFAVGYCIIQGWDPTDPDDIDNVNTHVPYTCTENFHWEYKNKSQLCVAADGTTGCNYNSWWVYNE